MGMVAAICTQCGANIEVDESKEAGICSHCGTAFITEKVINNYTIHNHNNVTNNIQNATITVKNNDDSEDYYNRYTAFMKLKKYNDAVKLVEEMTKKYPHKAITHYCRADLYLSIDYMTYQYEHSKKRYDGEYAFEEFDYDAIIAAMDNFMATPADEFIQKVKDAPIIEDGNYKPTRYYRYVHCVIDWVYDAFDSEYRICSQIFDLKECVDAASKLKACNSFFYYNSCSIKENKPELIEERLNMIDKSITAAQGFLSDDDRALYADFISGIENNRNAYARAKEKAFELAAYEKDVEKAILDTFNAGRKEYRHKQRIRNLIIAGVVVAVVAVAAIVLITKVF